MDLRCVNIEITLAVQARGKKLSERNQANDWKLPCISALGRQGKGARREGARYLIAELVEQSTVNRSVASSSPAQGGQFSERRLKPILIAFFCLSATTVSANKSNGCLKGDHFAILPSAVR
jgi:hypothetical protein